LAAFNCIIRDYIRLKNCKACWNYVSSCPLISWTNPSVGIRIILELIARATMPDIANLEHDVNQIKEELKVISTKVAVIENDLRYTATKADVEQIKEQLKHMSTKADVCQLEARMEHAMRNLIMWVVSSIIAMTGIAFAIARYVK